MLRDFRIAIVHCLMVGYLPAAYVAVLATGRRTVFALQDALACTSAECDRLAGSLRVPRRGLLIAALIGLGVGFVGPYLVPPVPESPWNPADWSAEVAWHRVLGPLTSMMGAALIFAVVVVSRRMSAIAEELETIDLFDPDVLLPFTRQGLTYALLAVGYLSIASLMVVTETGFGVIGGVMAASVLFVAVVALVLPLRGVHRRIERAKAEELAWIDAEIGERTSAFKASREVRTTGELADLVAYRGLVERVREWPIGTSSWLRFALYLLIPVGSWALAALVEHVVDRILS